MKSTTQPRCVKPAVLESCTCLVKPTYQNSYEAEAVPGVVEINGDYYALVCLGETSKDGFRLIKEECGSTYDIETSDGVLRCDCPDYIARRGRTGPKDRCKHGLALQSLRNARAI